MGKKRRGRERLECCISCGRSVPRTKAIEWNQRARFSSDMRTADDVSLISEQTVYYCISCAKHRGILEKKKRMNEARRGAF